MTLTQAEKNKIRGALKSTLRLLGPQTVEQARGYIMSKWTEIPEEHLQYKPVYNILKANPDIFEKPGYSVNGRAVWRLKLKTIAKPPVKAKDPAPPMPPIIKADDQKLFEKVMLALVASGSPDVKRAQEIVTAIRKAEGVKGGRYLYNPIMSLHMKFQVVKATPDIPARLEFTTPDGCTYLFDVDDVKYELDKLK